ncbi:hypothetical protein D3C72_977620 [compost metagenome]
MHEAAGGLLGRLAHELELGAVHGQGVLDAAGAIGERQGHLLELGHPLAGGLAGVDGLVVEAVEHRRHRALTRHPHRVLVKAHRQPDQPHVVRAGLQRQGAHPRHQGTVGVDGDVLDAGLKLHG